MKVIYQEKVKQFNQDTNKVEGIALVDKHIEVPFNFAAINIKEIEYEEGIFIPYNDAKLNEKIEFLMDEIAMWCDWSIPDIDKTKVEIYMDLTDEEFKPCLVITVQPLQLTANSIDGGLITPEIVANAIAFYNDPNYFCENMDTYRIEFDPDELKNLMWLIIGHIDMVHSGGHDVD